jgi:hypothetical protein
MRRSARFSTFLLILTNLLVLACASTRGDWELLGRKDVSFLGVDRDTLHVGRSQGRFRELKIMVEGAPVEMYDINVVFGDGSSFRPETRLHFEPGMESRTIDLPGSNRIIRRIDFVYRKTSGLFRKATVTVYGR